jgi:enamine deaminase RidA (YjgF/YER057c/UK114 family)
MANLSLYPDTLFDSTQFDFAQVVVAPGRKTIYVAGQTAWNRELNLPAGADVGTQLRAALENVRLALAAAGASPSDLVQLNTHIVNYSPALLPVIGPILREFLDPAHLPASLLVGVQALALPELLAEVTAVAVIEN